MICKTRSSGTDEVTPTVFPRAAPMSFGKFPRSSGKQKNLPQIPFSELYGPSAYREVLIERSARINERFGKRSEPQAPLNRATVDSCLGEVAVTVKVVFNEPAIHEFAIDEPTIRKARTRELTVREVAIDEVAMRKQAPIPCDLLERTAYEI
jgi:hypothetical protein